MTGAVVDRARRAPWHCELPARELVAAVVDRRYPPTAFRARFGDDALLDALDGEVQGLALLMSIEVACDVHVAALPDDPVVAACAWRWRCAHADEPGSTFDLERGIAYCAYCGPEMCELKDETLSAAREAREGPADLDHCDLCVDLATLSAFRLLVGSRFVQGRACGACFAYAGWT